MKIITLTHSIYEKGLINSLRKDFNKVIMRKDLDKVLMRKD